MTYALIALFVILLIVMFAWNHRFNKLNNSMAQLHNEHESRLSTLDRYVLTLHTRANVTDAGFADIDEQLTENGSAIAMINTLMDRGRGDKQGIRVPGVMFDGTDISAKRIDPKPFADGTPHSEGLPVNLDES